MDPRERQALTEALRRLQRGERAAADEVFRRAWPVVRAFASRWLSGSPQAEDVAQQALLKVFAQAIDFDGRRDALTWVLELTLWECRTERARVRRRREDAASPEATGPVEASRPDAALEAAELSAALGEVVAALPEAQRLEVERLLLEEASGGAAARKRRQRALDGLKALWRSVHGE